MGRSKKVNAVKPGQLQNGWQRFSFIAHKGVISGLKVLAKREGKSIKSVMDEILSHQILIRTGQKVLRTQFEKLPEVAKKKNELLMLNALRQRTQETDKGE